MEPSNKLSVMLIDDNEIDNYVHHKVIELTKCSREIAVYNSGNSALEYLDLNGNDVSKIPDLILLDLNMPILDGFEFLSLFEKMPETVKVKSKIIILSSSGRSADIERAYSNKYVVDYISKPLTSEILINSMKKSGVNSSLSL